MWGALTKYPKKEIKELKDEIPELRHEVLSKLAKLKNKPTFHLKPNISSDEEKCETSKVNDADNDEVNRLENVLNEQGNSLNILKDITIHKWYANVKLVRNKTFIIELPALIDTGAALNYIQECLVPTTYYAKTTEKLSSANGIQMNIKYKLPKLHVC